MKMALALTLVIGLIGAGADVVACNIQDASDEPRPTAEIGKTPAKPTAPVTGPKELIGRIADDIRDNYARVRTLRTILQTTSSDRSVTKREEVTNKMPNGLTVQLSGSRSPFGANEYHCAGKICSGKESVRTGKSGRSTAESGCNTYQSITRPGSGRLIRCPASRHSTRGISRRWSSDGFS